MSFNLDGLISSLLAKSCKSSFSLKMFINQIVMIPNYEEWFLKIQILSGKKLLLYDRNDKKMIIWSSNHLHAWGNVKSLTSSLNPWLIDSLSRSEIPGFNTGLKSGLHAGQSLGQVQEIIFYWAKMQNDRKTWVYEWMDGWITMKVKMRSKKIQNIPPTNNFNFCKIYYSCNALICHI